MQHAQKHIRKADIAGAPHSRIDVAGKDGTIKSRRYYNSIGGPQKDIDTTDHGNPKLHPFGTHAHNWDTAGEQLKRGRQRELTEGERAENQDIL